ncbi:MAG: helix-turn-helix domain-containing protein [Candidatus Aenigmatarchaeota archaeon]
MNVREDALEGIGLSKNESKVYLTILELGSASAGEITKDSGVHRRNVYDTIERLMKKGLVGHTTTNGVKHFEVPDPKYLFNLINKQKEDIQKKERLLSTIIPELLVTKNHKERSDVKVFRGPESRKIIFEDILNSAKENCVLGAHMPSKISKAHVKKWHRRRISQGIRDRFIYNKPDAYSDELLELPLTEVRFMPEEIETNTAINIYGNKVGMMLWSNGQPISILIDNEKVAKDFRIYFDVLWKKSRK